MINKSKILQALKADMKAADLLKRQQDEKIARWTSEYDGLPYGNEQDG